MPAAHDRRDTRSAEHDPGVDHDQQHQRDAEDVARHVRRGPRTRLLTVEMDVVVFVSHAPPRSEEHTSELQSLMRISYAVLCLKKKKSKKHGNRHNNDTSLIQKAEKKKNNSLMTTTELRDHLATQQTATTT